MPHGQNVSAFRAIICGWVQGVGFRYCASETATRLGLRGWVRNLSTGEVETWFEGAPDSCDAFLSWLEIGPPGSRVDSVTCTPREVDVTFHDFSIYP